jgi:hypothetical protein
MKIFLDSCYSYISEDFFFFLIKHKDHWIIFYKKMCVNVVYILDFNKKRKCFFETHMSCLFFLII